jgi:hypothetical protein
VTLQSPQASEVQGGRGTHSKTGGRDCGWRELFMRDIDESYRHRCGVVESEIHGVYINHGLREGGAG